MNDFYDSFDLTGTEKFLEIKKMYSVYNVSHTWPVHY